MNSDGWNNWSGGLNSTWAPDFSHSQENNNNIPGGIDRSGSPGNPVFDYALPGNQLPVLPQPGTAPAAPQAGGPPPIDGSAQMGTPEWAQQYQDYLIGMGTGGDGGGAGVGAPAGPMGGYVNPQQTYTGHTGYTSKGDGDGNFTNTPHGGGNLVGNPFLQDEEKILARPELQGSGREAFQASQFASTPQNPIAPPPTPGADANALSQSLPQYDADKQRGDQYAMAPQAPQRNPQVLSAPTPPQGRT
jgi:hypothetical protein